MDNQKSDQDSGEGGEGTVAFNESRQKPTPALDAALSGRELDAAVAERVLGWLPPDHPNTVAMRARQHMTHSIYDTYYLSPLGEIIPPFCYSTDIAAAMQVVEKMFADGWAVGIDRQIEDGKPLNYYGWEASFHGGNPRKGVYGDVEADTLPEAICRASLKAVEKSQRTKSSVSDATTDQGTGA